MPASDLQTTNCPNCGAALMGEARPGATLRCEFCGTPVRVPAPSKSASSNISITSQGDLQIGEFVGGDKIVARQITESDAPLPVPSKPRPDPNVLSAPAHPVTSTPTPYITESNRPLPAPPLPVTPPFIARRGWMLGLAAFGCVLCVALPVACGVLSLVIYR